MDCLLYYPGTWKVTGIEFANLKCKVELECLVNFNVIKKRERSRRKYSTDKKNVKNFTWENN